MAQVYGTESKYLERQQQTHFFKNYFFLIVAAALWVVVGSMLWLGLYFGRGPVMKWSLPVVGIVGTAALHYAYKHQGKQFNYQDGQAGEREVLAELKKLPDNYAIFCDSVFKGRKANIDYLISGPKGFFTIEVKNWKNVSSGSYLDSALNQTVRNTVQVQNFLSEFTKQKMFVKGMLVFSNKSVGVNSREERYITIIHKNNLNLYILSKKDVAYQSEILSLENHLISLTSHNL